MTKDSLGAAVLDQLHIFFLPRLESHCRASRYVEPHTIRSPSVKRERAINLEEVKMTANLDGAIAGILHSEARHAASGVSLNALGFFVEEILAWMHFLTSQGRER
jgi:hypothetical protein